MCADFAKSARYINQIRRRCNCKRRFNRQAQIGINIMGAFADRKIAPSAGVRAFGGKDNIGGANVGVFLRRVDGELFMGLILLPIMKAAIMASFCAMALAANCKVLMRHWQ